VRSSVANTKKTEAMETLRELAAKVGIASTGFVYRPATINGALNPVHLAVAATGYQVQSEILGILHSLSFFSPGPPPLQAEQGAMLCHLAIVACGDILFIVALRLLFYYGGVPVRDGSFEALGGISMSFLVFDLLIARYAIPRSPDYDWGEWKLPPADL
jgi:hypothetical protein